MLILDPSPLTLLTQFLINSEKWGDTALSTSSEVNDPLTAAGRTKKSRSLKMMALETAAFLDWDLDVLSKFVLNRIDCCYICYFSRFCDTLFGIF